MFVLYQRRNEFEVEVDVPSLYHLKTRGGIGVAGDRRISKFACHRTQGFFKVVPKTSDLVFAEAADL